MAEPRFEIKIGSPVMATDGEYGRLQALVLDPRRVRVVALLVRRHGLPPSRIVVVPEEAVARATENEVQLKISREQVQALPEYQPDSGLVADGHKYETDDQTFAVRGAQGIQVGRTHASGKPGLLESQLTGSEMEHLALRLRAGQQVFCRDGHAGRVSLILLDPWGQVKGFVMHSGHLPGENLIVPVAWVQEVDGENVHLSMENYALLSLPAYSPDYVLAEEVEKALWAEEILRETDVHDISFPVQDGIVSLRGHVVTLWNKHRAEEIARSVAGVLGVENHLVVDDELAIDVAQALSGDQRTRQEKVYVGAQHGVLTLTGQVPSLAIRQAAEEVAARVPQVRAVANYLEAPEAVIDPESQRVLQPPTRGLVYATDIPLGNVERVIINPHNRRVTAFVAHGKFPDPGYAGKHMMPDEIPQQERHVVIPTRAVRYETENSVLLNVSSLEAARYRDLDSTDLVSAPIGWQPPYPYQWDEVLFVQVNG